MYRQGARRQRTYRLGLQSPCTWQPELRSRSVAGQTQSLNEWYELCGSHLGCIHSFHSPVIVPMCMASAGICEGTTDSCDARLVGHRLAYNSNGSGGLQTPAMSASDTLRVWALDRGEKTRTAALGMRSVIDLANTRQRRETLASLPSRTFCSYPRTPTINCLRC
jgi:hypothetical protein